MTMSGLSFDQNKDKLLHSQSCYSQRSELDMRGAEWDLLA